MIALQSANRRSFLFFEGCLGGTFQNLSTAFSAKFGPSIPNILPLMAELKIHEELHDQRVDQMIHAPISFPFQPYAL
jgi:hypothetical protein